MKPALRIPPAPLAAAIMLIAACGLGHAASLPSVTTPTAVEVTSNSAILGGTVDSDGSAPVTALGVVYAPTATNSNPQIDGPGVTNVPGTDTSGVFTVDVSNLLSGTAYSFAAYATNSVGTPTTRATRM